MKTPDSVKNPERNAPTKSSRCKGVALPEVPTPSTEAPTRRCLAVSVVQAGPTWTGWAVIPAEVASTISAARDAAEFEARLLDFARSSGTVSVVECPISFATAGGFLESQGALLSGRGPKG